MENLTQKEIKFLEKKGIDLSKLKTRWEWVKNKRIAIEFYREVIYLHFNNVPSNEKIDSIGYRGFRDAIKRLDLKMT